MSPAAPLHKRTEGHVLLLLQTRLRQSRQVQANQALLAHSARPQQQATEGEGRQQLDHPSQQAALVAGTAPGFRHPPQGVETRQPLAVGVQSRQPAAAAGRQLAVEVESPPRQAAPRHLSGTAVRPRPGAAARCQLCQRQPAPEPTRTAQLALTTAATARPPKARERSGQRQLQCTSGPASQRAPQPLRTRTQPGGKVSYLPPSLAS